MKIADVKAVYPNYQHVVPSWRTNFWQIVVRVETDLGVVGLGYGGGGIASVEIVNRHFRELMLGRRVDTTADIAALWDDLYLESLPYGRKGLAVMALSGVDLALWDLLGKAENKPVHQLIGPPTRERVRVYATGMDTDWYADLGITGQKLRNRWRGDPMVGWAGSIEQYEQAVAEVSRAHRSLGDDALLMIDTYLTWDAEVTREMTQRLAEYNLFWFEDVLTPDRLEEQAELRPVVKPTLLAGGEHEFTRYGFADIARHGALDIWQPDLTWCGGITEALRILELERDDQVRIIPHRGGEVWGLHLIMATECADLAELVMGNRDEPRDQLWLGEPRPVDGYLHLPEGPGFGVTLNESLL